MQLDKILQSQGFGSRRTSQQLIKRGRVWVQGIEISNPKADFDPVNFEFSVNGQSTVYRKNVYIALHKPTGYECSHQSQHHSSAFDLVPDYLVARGLQSIGRLDQDSTGLLLLTDDGAYLHALSHPRKHVPKRYAMRTSDPIRADQLERLIAGVELNGESGLFAAHHCTQDGDHQLSFTIHQGVYHQVKRMLAAVGNHVTALHRLQIGQLAMTDLALQQGEWCYLNEAQIQQAAQRDGLL